MDSKYLYLIFGLVIFMAYAEWMERRPSFKTQSEKEANELRRLDYHVSCYQYSIAPYFMPYGIKQLGTKFQCFCPRFNFTFVADDLVSAVEGTRKEIQRNLEIEMRATCCNC